MTSKTRIQIVTRLSDTIYRSSGGGQEIALSTTYASGPRGLRSALKAMSNEKASNVAGYGNIGCGSTWLRIVEGTETLDLDGWSDWLPEGADVPGDVAGWKIWLAQQREIARLINAEDDAKRAAEDAMYAAQYNAERG